MKLQHLRDIVAISQNGSIRNAARRLGTVQPALTRSLSELERELGAPLFERHAKGMPTFLGEAFVKRATAILNDVRRATEEIEQLKGNPVGVVTIGLSIASSPASESTQTAFPQCPSSDHRRVLSNA
jgi:LysR family transcriptional regulator, regulator of abg operon